jgi:hypothetical protein
MSPRPILADLEQQREPPPPIALGDTGRDLYAATLPVAYGDPDNGWAWAHYCGALAHLLDVIAEMVRDDADGNPGWTALGSPTRCPPEWLRVLAQWAGVHRWDSMSPADLRGLIGPHAPGLWRGTKAAMIAAVRRHFPPGTADAYLYFEERADGDPYLLRVFTYEFVDHDTAAVEASLRAEKPAGLNLEYELRVGQTWAMLNGRKTSWDQTRTDYATWWDVWHDPPPGVTPPPRIDSIDPSSGDVAGGTAITLDGAGLTGTTGVTFGGAAATGVTVVDDGTVTATTPPGAAGAVDVVVTAPGGTDTLAGGFTYTDAPPPAAALDSCTPNTAALATTPTVQLLGTFPATDMTGYTAVITPAGGAAVAGAVTKVDDTELGATIAIGVALADGPGTIHVADAGGVGYTNTVPFTITTSEA